MSELLVYAIVWLVISLGVGLALGKLARMGRRWWLVIRCDHCDYARLPLTEIDGLALCRTCLANYEEQRAQDAAADDAAAGREWHEFHVELTDSVILAAGGSDLKRLDWGQMYGADQVFFSLSGAACVYRAGELAVFGERVTAELCASVLKEVAARVAA